MALGATILWVLSGEDGGTLKFCVLTNPSRGRLLNTSERERESQGLNIKLNVTDV